MNPLLSSGAISSDSDTNAATVPSPDRALGASEERKKPWIPESLVPVLKSAVPLGREIQLVASMPPTVMPSARVNTWLKSPSACGEQPGELVVNETRLPFGAIAASLAGRVSRAAPWQRLASDVPPRNPVSLTYTSGLPFVSRPDRLGASVRKAIFAPFAEIDASNDVPSAFAPPPWLATNVAAVLKS